MPLLGDERVRHEAERRAWRESSATFPSPDDPEPLHRAVEVLRLQCEEAGRHALESLAQERDRLQVAARRGRSRPTGVRCRQLDERERLDGPLEQALGQEAAEASRLGDELAGRVRALMPSWPASPERS